jgi:hypothetical protein
MSAAVKTKPMDNFNLLLSSTEYFNEVVDDALKSRKLKADLYVKQYLVNLLEFYLSTENLFEKETVDESGKRKPQTLAELYLIAVNSEWNMKVDLLRKLGDRALYISGFFGDSFARKIIDVDYYVNMGGNAYYELSYSLQKNDPLKKVYSVFSKRFPEFVDTLTYISHKSMISNNQSVLRLYDNYLKTGSELAKEKLMEMGIVTVSLDKKTVKQN